MSTTMPDQVAVQKASGYNMISIEQWLQLPVSERIELFRLDKVQFLREGDLIDSFEAMRALKGRDD